MKFIIVQDMEVAIKLTKMGFEPLQNTGSGFFVFANDPKIQNFCSEGIEKGALIFTDKLFF